MKYFKLDGHKLYKIIDNGKSIGKAKCICLESRYPCDCTYSSDFTSPGSGCTAACNYWSNPGSVHQIPNTAGWPDTVRNTKFASADTSTHGQHRESNPRPFDLKSNVLSAWSHVPIYIYLIMDYILLSCIPYRKFNNALSLYSIFIWIYRKWCSNTVITY